MSGAAEVDLKALKYLSEACRLGSITKAAALLNVAQPALSRQIRLLEEELGVVLLLRLR
jgi:LysR family transcriptional regulator, nitrogen assimilation regulatory protein